MTAPIPAFALFGEASAFPDVLHLERIPDRAGPHGWRIADHRHPEMHQVLLLEAGGALLRVEGERRALDPPALVTIPAGTVHGFAFEAGSEGAVLTLPVAEIPAAVGAGGTTGRWAVLTPDGRARRLMAEIAAEHAAERAGRAEMLRALAVCLLLHLARALGPATAPAPGGLAARFEALARARAREGWRVGDYAAALAVSRSALERAVRAATGLSPRRVAAGVLHREARRQLAYTRRPVAAIAEDLGFADPAYFSRAFRRQAGLSPTAYRDRFSGGADARP